ncbi:Kinesin domain-containing protein/Kinesin-relat_1 domain-containing protein [Cephalotus follicularis]|uniref:Kinesin domain-containing protein/Kinesin-relat_1 domain-containing protein n=1 Tax=Cephalotus follicularis TaxID=3775 RepID=A0A1Q3D1P1_CEPFO|nr:Kinesin domain-containing protein/Kinesin-relat_1 domain-containing protein [Cephalotus follicularis]
MPFLSETASAVKGSRENLVAQSPASTSVVRNIIELDEATTSLLPPPLPSQSFDFSDDPSFWKDHNVQVIIRIRPLSSSEISVQGYNKCVKQESCQSITWTGHPESRFTFDVVADENVSQEKLFKVAGLPMVENCMGGYNSCMFAYGQTGSGKTHTMLGDIEEGTRRHSVNCGMTPRVFEHLFSRIQKEKEARKDEKLIFTCKCSFLEIYNEQILDLLDPSSCNLQIREDIKKGVYVENLKEMEVTCARDVIQQLIQGAANRKVAATNMNRASSRSHSVFTCIIESKWESQGVSHRRFARLNLVDLAGSERQKSSGAEGERLKEATNINKSLSTLGLVIMNLVNISNGKSLHVPYRDSKLTFLLQDSLGGNSKTTIIANISPSSCCSLETLSTLKFAQRAKFIKNNAIVNEDASGDVIAMRMQIQQLKKEVSHLRGLANGGAENLDNDSLAVIFPGSPGSFKWDGLNGSFSPLTCDKRVSQKKDYEVALVGAFKREKEKDIALQALTAENQATMQLAKQREDEIQGLKMRLRFREAGIKRLEAVASGSISAETHLLREKEEYLKEIEVLRSQVDRNQEVTRFAMENLRLKEEIRRLKSFYEEGEREMMNEQIMVLQNKLLEALDWKLMHESDFSMFEKANSNVVPEVRSDGDLLLFEQKIEEERFSKVMTEESQQIKLPLSTDIPIISRDDQMELKTMVDAIAAASEREAEAHEIAIRLSEDNDKLRLKLNDLLQDNERLIDLYEKASAECNNKNLNEAESSQEHVMEDHAGSCLDELAREKVIEMKEVVENLEHQLIEMHEENDKLMGLYEEAMHERDEYKRKLSDGQYKTETRGEFDCPEKLAEVNGEECLVSGETLTCTEDKCLPEETGLHGLNLQDSHIDPLVHEFLQLSVSPSCVEADHSSEYRAKKTNRDHQTDAGNQVDIAICSNVSAEPLNLTATDALEDLNTVRMKLETAEEKLLDSSKIFTVLGSLEKAFIELDKLSKEIEAAEGDARVKQQQLRCHKLLHSEMQERKVCVNNKLLALKYSLSNFSSSAAYFEQREARARSRVHTSISYLEQKKEELTHLQACKGNFEADLRKIQQSEVELRDNHAFLKSKFEEMKQRHENETGVLFAIDNIDKTDPKRNWHLSSPATELLKSEEEKTKLQTEIKLSREKLGAITRELEDLDKKSKKIGNEMCAVQVQIQKGARSVEEMELALQGVIQEKETLLEVRENGKTEIDSMIIEYQCRVFEADLKEAEMDILEEELQLELKRIDELRTVKVTAAKKMTQLLEDKMSHSCFLSEKIQEELLTAWESVLEAKRLLGTHSSDS